MRLLPSWSGSSPGTLKTRKAFHFTSVTGARSSHGGGVCRSMGASSLSSIEQEKPNSSRALVTKRRLGSGRLRGGHLVAVPREVKRLYAALKQLPAIHSVDSSVESLQGLIEEDIRLADCTQLPHGALRRTAGGRDGEIYVKFEFR